MKIVLPFVIKRSILHQATKIKLALQPPGKPVWLNVGAGNVSGVNGWTTLDICRRADYWWDASRPLPFRDGTVDRVYSSHMLEHLPYREIVRFLKEVHRILKPGGEVSIAVPDAAIYLDAYFKKETLPESLLSYQVAVYSKLPIDMVNYIAYMGGEHHHLFTADNLLAVLRNAGFCGVQAREFDAKIDVACRRHESVYAAARKQD
jgi:predicted SAM-dependent methyltransferase